MALTAEQHSERANGIGGSDVAAILGLDRYRTAYELWAEKTGRLSRTEAGDAAAIGHLMEEPIAGLYVRETGHKVRRQNAAAVLDGHPHILAHPDRMVIGQQRGVEIKNVGAGPARDWGPSGSDEVAEYYLPQVYQLMLTTDYPVWDVCAYFGGADVRVYTIERDPQWDTVITEACDTFWHDHVVADKEPPMDYGHRSTPALLERLYPGTDGSTVVLTDFDSNIDAWHQVFVHAKEKKKHYEQIVEGAKNHIMDAMGEAAIGILPDGTGYTRKRVERKGFEVEATSFVQLRWKKGVAG